MSVVVFKLQTPDVELWFSGFVAAGTLILAMATGLLARRTGTVAQETRQLAKETTELAKRTAEDVSAQFRPALTADVHKWWTFHREGQTHEPPTVSYATGNLDILIRNSGHGPALSVHARLEPGNKAASLWNQGAFPTGEVINLSFRGVPPPDDTLTVVLVYTDLAANAYESQIDVQRAPVGARSDEVYRVSAVRIRPTSPAA